jgi:hypothetical protein
MTLAAFIFLLQLAGCFTLSYNHLLTWAKMQNTGSSRNDESLLHLRPVHAKAQAKAAQNWWLWQLESLSSDGMTKEESRSGATMVTTDW